MRLSADDGRPGLMIARGSVGWASFQVGGQRRRLVSETPSDPATTVTVSNAKSWPDHSGPILTDLTILARVAGHLGDWHVEEPNRQQE